MCLRQWVEAVGWARLACCTQEAAHTVGRSGLRWWFFAGAIGAVASNGAIGLNGWLPWDIPEELAYFEKTVDGAALPDPLAKTVVRSADAWWANYEKQPLIWLLPKTQMEAV